MESKTKEQLIEEVALLREEVAELKEEKAARLRAERLLQALNEASRSMEQALTPDEIFSAVAGELEKLGFRCAVFLTDQGRRRLFLKYWSYETAAIKAAERLVGRKHEDFPILIEAVDEYGKTVWERQTVFIGNVKDVIRQLFQPVLPGPSKKLAGPVAKLLKVSKDINAPLIAGDEVVGMLSVQSGDLTRDDMPAITAFAYQMAAAWHKATLLQDLKRNLAERNRAEEALQKAHDELERRVEERTAELVKSNEQLTREITERMRAEERVQHLNLVLRAIRTVNQVMARETDRSQLLKGICRSLTETRGYHNAWIALLDESGELREYAESGLGDDLLPMKERLERGELPHCARRALEQSSPIMTENPPLSCSDCPLSGNYKGRGGLTIGLWHGAKCYGVMALSVPAELLSDDEEVVLFREIAHDIAFALGSLELEERRKRAEQQLEESKELYRALVEAGADMGEAIVLLQNTAKVEAAHLFANQEWVRITGYTLEELREISYFDLIHPRDRDAVADRNRRRLQGEDVPGLWEIPIIAKDGSEVPVEGIGALLTYQGKPAVVGYIRDITERKRAEEERLAATRRAEETMESMIDGVVILDFDGVTLQTNSAFERQTGYKKEEVIGKTVQELGIVPAEDFQKIPEQMPEILKKGYLQNVEAIVTRKDGTKFNAFNNFTVLRDVKGNPMGLIVVTRDMTERKRAEQELEESKERYRALVEAGADMGEAIVLLQNTAKVESAHLFANDEWVRITGYTREELREISYFDLIHPRHRDAVVDRGRRRFQGELLPGP